MQWKLLNNILQLGILSTHYANKHLILRSIRLIILIIMFFFSAFAFLPMSLLSTLCTYVYPGSSLTNYSSDTWFFSGILSPGIFTSWLTYSIISFHLKLTSAHNDSNPSLVNGFRSGIYSTVLHSIVHSAYSQDISGCDISLNCEHDEILHEVCSCPIHEIEGL